MSQLDLADIQGNILRGYRKRNVRHYGCALASPRKAARLLGRMVSGDRADAPQVTRAEDWWERPEACVNLGFTAAGLRALGLPESIVRLFPEAFVGGPERNANGIGDRGPSAPDTWIVGGPGNPAVHLVVSVFTDESDRPVMADHDAALRALFKAHELSVVWDMDGYTQPDDKVHFGYRDGIAQPRIKGASAGLRADRQPECEPGEFLLGKDHVNQFGGNFLGDLPGALGDNGTFAALRVLYQDAAAFEAFLVRAGKRYNLHPELVAAKIMGRWRNGTPLMLAPDMVDGPPGEDGRPTQVMPTVPREQWNAFDYEPSADNPTWRDDAEGRLCPVGSHIRRLNPRGALVMGKPHTRRIIRRGMSYGDVYEPDQPASAGVDRGLVGYFICGDLELQFEFLLQVWANMDIATSGMRGTRDPVLGAQPPEGGQFVMRTDGRNDPVIFTDLPLLVRTRGSLYVFMPGIGGLRFLAELA